MGNEVSGIAVASRWAIRDQQQLILQGEGSQPGGLALRLQVEAPQGLVSLCCAATYLYHDGNFRERKMLQLARFARGAQGRNDSTIRPFWSAISMRRRNRPRSAI